MNLQDTKTAVAIFFFYTEIFLQSDAMVAMLPSRSIFNPAKEDQKEGRSRGEGGLDGGGEPLQSAGSTAPTFCSFLMFSSAFTTSACRH